MEKSNNIFDSLGITNLNNFILNYCSIFLIAILIISSIFVILIIHSAKKSDENKPSYYPYIFLSILFFFSAGTAIGLTVTEVMTSLIMGIFSILGILLSIKYLHKIIGQKYSTLIFVITFLSIPSWLFGAQFGIYMRTHNSLGISQNKSFNSKVDLIEEQIKEFGKTTCDELTPKQKAILLTSLNEYGNKSVFIFKNQKSNILFNSLEKYAFTFDPTEHNVNNIPKSTSNSSQTNASFLRSNKSTLLNELLASILKNDFITYNNVIKYKPCWDNFICKLEKNGNGDLVKFLLNKRIEMQIFLSALMLSEENGTDYVNKIIDNINKDKSEIKVSNGKEITEKNLVNKAILFLREDDEKNKNKINRIKEMLNSYKRKDRNEN